MPFNYPWKADQPPFVAGIMTLTNDEVLYVQTECAKIAEAYKQVNPWDNPTPSDDYIISSYNGIDAWKKAINGDTYAAIKQYDPEANKLGINENGIVQEVTEVQPEVGEG